MIEDGSKRIAEEIIGNMVTAAALTAVIAN